MLTHRALLRALPKRSIAHRALHTTPQRSSQLADFGKAHIAHGLKRVTDTVMESGSGAWVTMEGGRKVLDFSSGIGVVNFGHCHPKISGAAAEQAMKIVHAQSSIAFSRPYVELVERLIPLMPHPSLDTFFFWNSGAEAVEASIKLARMATKRQNVIVMQGGFHGRTYATMSLTRSKTIYSLGQGPLMPGVFPMPFPYWHQLGLTPEATEEEMVRSCLYQLQLILAQQSAPSDTAAILLESVLGEGGYVPAPPSFLRGLREVCDKHGILLIIDEVQAGWARTGKMFCIEHSGVKPDVMITAKGLANGFPLSAIVTRKELADVQAPGTMGGTYNGNAVSCAAAIAVTKVVQEEKVLENVAARSVELISALKEMQSSPALNGLIADVRGLGLMIGVEFNSPNPSVAGDLPANIVPSAPANAASRIANKCLEKGMLILTTSVYEVIRFIPTLNVTEDELKEGLRIFKEACEEVVREG
ncbi:acetylornithine aminotransferase [Dacryopinax primogenitus]|uniref:Acetylornithine aminotransferase n=1 Tax=Dacryopinax primogenitus (strain DJM 731) TaxID=1858805 RepID=M5G893_DACPD|nr:acetylornithine aminotransferase [Dacryopinax primogenitus]EJU04365.1 acetylornithine aminotransferase [Dacryopinax primogenitus]